MRTVDRMLNGYVVSPLLKACQVLFHSIFVPISFKEERGRISLSSSGKKSKIKRTFLFKIHQRQALTESGAFHKELHNCLDIGYRQLAEEEKRFGMRTEKHRPRADKHMVTMVRLEKAPATPGRHRDIDFDA